MAEGLSEILTRHIVLISYWKIGFEWTSKGIIRTDDFSYQSCESEFIIWI